MAPTLDASAAHIVAGTVAGTVAAKWAKGTGGPAGDESHNLVPSFVWPVEVADPITANEGATYTHEGSRNFRLHNVVPSMQSSAEPGYIHPRQLRNSQSSNQIGIKPEAKVTDALTSEGPGAVLVEPLPFDTTQVTSRVNRSVPKHGDPFHPLARGGHAPAVAFDMYNQSATGDVTQTLCSRGDTPGGSAHLVPAVAFSCKDYGGDARVELSPTLRAMPHDGSHANGGGQVAVAVNVEHALHESGNFDLRDVAQPLTRSEHKGHTVVLSPLSAVAFKPSHYTRGKDGAPSDVAAPLSADADKGDQDTLVAVSSGRGWWSESTTGATLRAQDSVTKADTLVATAFEPRYFNRENKTGGAPSEVATLTASAAKAGDAAPTVYTLEVRGREDGRRLEYRQDGTANALRTSNGGRDGMGVGAVAAPTLTSTNDPSRSPQATEVTQQVAAVHATTMAVRRLTPRECERLQGFADDWTAITYRGKPAADGPRYKALGNSMAVNVMRWVGERIHMHELATAMAPPQAPATAPRVVLPEEIADLRLVVSVSGGKDSTATMLALREAGLPFDAVFADTGWEAKETYEYLDQLEAMLGLKIARVGHPGGMLDKVRRRAIFPARMQRWCTQELKRLPIRKYLDSLGEEVVSVVGVRAEESDARAKYPELEDDHEWGGYVWRPILRWSVQDVLAIHQRHNIPLNPLYHRGHDRVGCYPCIFSRKEEIRLIADHSPERIDLIRNLETEIQAERARRNEEQPGRYSHVEASFFQTRMRNKQGAMSIDEIVAWSRTDRKGLPILLDVPSGGCFRWGMCERPEPPQVPEPPDPPLPPPQHTPLLAPPASVLGLAVRDVRYTTAMLDVLARLRPGRQPIFSVLPFDFETFLIQPGITAPRLVCMSHVLMAQPATYGPVLLHATFDRQLLLHTLRASLEDPHVLLVGANVSFDLLVAMAEFPELTPAVFRALDEDRVMCVQLSQQLIDIAQNQFEGRLLPDGSRLKHEYTLAALAKRHLGLDMDKDTWRLKYGTLIDVPVARWEQGAIDYSIGDAVVTGAVWQAMLEGREQYRLPVEALLPDVFRQTRAQFWLALMVGRGFRLDPKMVGLLKALVEAELERVVSRLRHAGLVRPDGSRDTKAAAARMLAVCAQRGLPVKRTDKDGVALDEEACIDSGDGILADYASFTSLSTVLTKDIGALEEPALRGMPIQSRFDTLKETGRTSCSGGKSRKASTYGYQLQNPRRQLGIERLARLDPKIDEKIGVRQAFVAREGFVLSTNDFSMFEACSWCQASIAVGRPIHRMIDALNTKKDVHLALAARWLGTTYEDVEARKKAPEVKEARQRCKPGTFGFMGGMGWRTFIAYAKNNYQVVFSEEEAQRIRDAWYSAWEPKPWFDYIANLVGRSDMGEVVHVGSQRRRAWVPFTVASNSYFQGLAADCAKDAGYEISREMFLGVDRQGRPSPLGGSRIVNFVHDEFICEHPVELGHEAAYRVAGLMMEAGRRWMPDVPPSVEPALMWRWIKSAEGRFDAAGRLVPFVPGGS